MNHFEHRFLNPFMALFVILISLQFFFSCSTDNLNEKKESPAKVENKVKENDLTTITLTPKAEERLGIETASVAYRNTPGIVELGGEIMALPGTEVKVTAPVTGTILQNNSSAAVHAGTRVKQGQEILRLLLMPPGMDLMGMQEEVTVKEAQFEVAQAKMERAGQLLKDRAISEKVYQEVQATLAGAQAELKAAKAKLNLLSGTAVDSAATNLSTLVLEAPIDGVVQHFYVAPGQTVPASTPLFDITSQNPVWVRVPIYSGDLAKIDLSKKVRIQSLGTNAHDLNVEAEPIQGPTLSDANSVSSDLYFRLENDNELFRIGERVRVNLVQKAEGNSLVVPFTAIVYDIYGGTWVYEKVSPHVFIRRRVEVSNIIDGLAVLRRGIKVGVEVVTAGVAELYGTEFGGGK